LAPRTKPVDPSESDKRSSSSTIFGGAKARDEEAWQQRRMSHPKEPEGADGKESSEQPNPTDEMVAPIDTKDSVSGTGTAPEQKDGAPNKSFQNQERRQSGRGRGGSGGGGRGRGGRGNIVGGGRNDKGENNRRGSKRNPQQQDKKQDKQQQPKQLTPEEKEAAAAAKLQAAATVPKQDTKKTEASNKFALLMEDSDSD
jgi:hypothetical protein